MGVSFQTSLYSDIIIYSIYEKSAKGIKRNTLHRCDCVLLNVSVRKEKLVRKLASETNFIRVYKKKQFCVVHAGCSVYIQGVLRTVEMLFSAAVASLSLYRPRFDPRTSRGNSSVEKTRPSRVSFLGHG